MICKYCYKSIMVKSLWMTHEKYCPLNPDRPKPTADHGEYRCKYCSKLCKRPGTLHIHEQACSANPCATHKQHNYCNFHRELTARPEGWECNICHCILRTKNLLYSHKHTEHPGTIKTRNRSQICPFCNEHYTGTRRNHYKICTVKPHGPHVWTDAERKKQSELKRQYAKEHPELCSWRTSAKFISLQCETLKTILAEHGLVFTAEYSDTSWSHAYSLDIAFTDIKLDIEINGNQHYCNGQLKPYYQERHDYLVSQGWEVIEWHFKNCYQQTKIDDLIRYIEDKLSIQT